MKVDMNRFAEYKISEPLAQIFDTLFLTVF